MKSKLLCKKTSDGIMSKRLSWCKTVLHSKQWPLLCLSSGDHDARSFTPRQSSPCLEHLHGLHGHTVEGLASETSLQIKRVISS